MDVPGWLPDWHDLSHYPDPDKDSMEIFAWEFLRRNPEYQADYERVWGSLSESQRRAVLENLVPLQPDESEADYRQRWDDNAATAGEFYSRSHPLAWLRRKWGLFDSLPLWSLEDGLSPAISLPIARKVLAAERLAPGDLGGPYSELGSSPAISPGGFEYGQWNERRVIQTLLHMEGETIDRLVEASAKAVDNSDPHLKCRVEIDLRLPISIQLDRLKEVLEERQLGAEEHGDVIKPPRMPRKLVTYLRVLDAKLVGETSRNIAAELYPSKQDDYASGYQASNVVNKDLKAATEYRDGRYLELALLKSR